MICVFIAKGQEIEFHLFIFASMHKHTLLNAHTNTEDAEIQIYFFSSIFVFGREIKKMGLLLPGQIEYGANREYMEKLFPCVG